MIPQTDTLMHRQKFQTFNSVLLHCGLKNHDIQTDTGIYPQCCETLTKPPNSLRSSYVSNKQAEIVNGTWYACSEELIHIKSDLSVHWRHGMKVIATIIGTWYDLFILYRMLLFYFLKYQLVIALVVSNHLLTQAQLLCSTCTFAILPWAQHWLFNNNVLFATLVHIRLQDQCYQRLI